VSTGLRVGFSLLAAGDDAEADMDADGAVTVAGGIRCGHKPVVQTQSKTGLI